MKILIPTAKNMNPNLPASKYTPIKEKTENIARTLSKMQTEELAKIYKIKPEQAKNEAKRFQDIYNKKAVMYPAIDLFDGLMYRSMGREKWSLKEKSYLESHVFICSSLYGVIPAFMPISEHRLDFLQNIKIDGLNLKQYWQEDFDNAIANEDVVISLLSEEFEKVFSKKGRSGLIRPLFKERKGEVLKVHSTISKKGRGKFLAALMEKNITSAENIRGLQFDDFCYGGEEEGRPLFIKDLKKVSKY